MIDRILYQNPNVWEERIDAYVTRNMNLRIKNENSPPILFEFNQQLSHLHDEVCYDFYRARAFVDGLDKTIDRIIKSVEQDRGKNESARRAAGIRDCQNYIHNGSSVNLYDILDRWSYLEHVLDSLMKSIRFKADAKITNNSLLNLERNLVR